MDKYKLGIGDAHLLNFWLVLERFKEGMSIMEAIEAVIAEPYNKENPEMGGYDGAILSKLITIEDKVKICKAFIRFLADVEPQLLFRLSDNSGGEGKRIEPKPDIITTNGTYTAIGDNLDGYSSVEVNVRPTGGTLPITSNGTGIDVADYEYVDVQVEPTETLQVSIESSESPKTVDVKDAAFVEITIVG